MGNILNNCMECIRTDKLFNKMKGSELRVLESDTRMRFLIGNNPMGEIVKILNRECKRKHITKRKKIC